jgi:protein SCO1/2
MKLQSAGESLHPTRIIQIALILGLLNCGLITGAHGQAAKPALPKAVSPSASRGKVIGIGEARALIPDIEVLTHDGKRVHLYSDLIKDKVVLVNFFFTSCTYVCRMQGRSLAKVQDELGDRLGRDVFLVSISMDPQTDTPEKLKYWGRQMGVRPGWTLVSSDTPEMKKMIEDFTGNLPGPQEVHDSVAFIGNDKTGEWVATDGLSGTYSVLKLFETLSRTAATKRPN